jgi:crotonobetaine/carnitine-CoA ligase
MTFQNLARSITEQAESRPALRIGTAGDQISLSETLAYAAGRAGVLLGQGVQPGRPVALIGSTSTDYLITWLACLLAGVPVALVNPSYPSELTDRMLSPVSPQRVLRQTEIASAREVRDDIGGLPGLDVSSDEIASMMHTSGTTGLPKFCLQTHDYFRLMADAVKTTLGIQPSDRVFAPLPMFHINPLGYGVVTSVLSGADVLTTERFSARKFWPPVVEHEVSVLILHAPPVEILKRTTAAEDAAGHHVRTMFFADREFMRRFAIPTAASGYGSTEAGGLSHLKLWRSPEEMPPNASRHGGHPRPDIEWRLDAGEILIRERLQSALFGGYLRQDGPDPARDSEGWFHTGDLGRPADDDPGYLIFVERAAESIRVRGEYVPIEFVESELSTIDGLSDHALWKRAGELVDDEVVLFAAGDPLPLEQLRERIATLPVFMQPTAIAHVRAVPRDAAVGKVQRRRLNEEPVLAWIELK